MCNFAVELFEPIRRDGVIRFYKLLVDGKAQIDSFYDELCKNKTLEKEFKEILSCMNYVAETNASLPKNKVNSIKDGGKEIAIEFKKKNLRVYCFKKEPDVFVILGGYKNNQKKDVEKLKRLLKTERGFVDNLQQAIEKEENTDLL